MDIFIRANKCIIGEVYYLTGDAYEYNLVTRKNTPMMNSPVKFTGKENTSNNGKTWFDCTGKHKFEFVNNPGKFIYAYASTDLLRSPILDAEILKIKN